MTALAAAWTVLRSLLVALIGLLALAVVAFGAAQMLLPSLPVADPATAGAVIVFAALTGAALLIRLLARAQAGAPRPSPIGRAFTLLWPIVGTALGLWLVHGVAPWELRHGEATVAGIQTHISFTNSDDPSDDAIGAVLDFTSAEHACTFRYFLHHRSRREAAAALAVGDRLRFSYRQSGHALATEMAGYDCLATPPPRQREAILEIGDLEKNGAPVLMRRPTRHVRAAAGAGLLAIAAVALTAAAIRRRR